MSEKIKERGIPAEQVHQEMNEEHAQIPPASPEQLEAALEVLGEELARRSALVELEGEADAGLAAALNALTWIEYALKGINDPDDYYGLAEQVRDSLDRVLAAEA